MTDSSRSSASLVRGICFGGTVAGILDISAAILSSLPRNVGPMRVIQSVASGLLGQPAFEGGLPTVALGLGLHFLIAFLFAAFFSLALDRAGDLGRKIARKWFLTGPVYGGFIYLMMYLVIVPNSRAPFKFKFTAYTITLNLAIHIFCIGIPIAFFARRKS
jgi:hypothetical protein